MEVVPGGPRPRARQRHHPGWDRERPERRHRDSGATSADYDFIAGARQDVPLLLEEVARLRALTSNEASVLLLDATSNQAVVKLPGRVFPGVVLQGDTLHGLRGDVGEALDLLRSGDRASAEPALSWVLERMSDVLAHYEAVAGRSGYKLPY